MTTWFTSDLHFNHVNIMLPSYTRREETFPDLQAMNEGLVQRWNERVKPDDDVYLIGDLAMGKKAEALPYLNRLVGHKHLIFGNHDYKDHKCTAVHPAILQAYKEGVLETTVESLPVLENGKRLFLHHEPCSVPETFDYVFCGHVHESFTRARWDAERLNTETGKPGVAVADPDGNIINVGVDVSDYKPMTLEELLARPFYEGPKHRI
jgi:calcineurin-like phosphoesterase family protein